MLPDRRRTQTPKRRGTLAGAAQRAMQRFRETRRETRIGFIVDATGSRAHAWAEAQTIQARMFRAVGRKSGIRLRLVHFGGNEIADHGWLGDSGSIGTRMKRVRCVQGLTQILPALARFARAPEGERAQAVILTGDAFEEDPERAARIGDELAAAGIPVFSFIEGGDPAATAVFRDLAMRTGGRFARFGDELPLDELCAGAAMIAAGDADGVRKLKNEKVRRLLLAGPDRKAKGDAA